MNPMIYVLITLTPILAVLSIQVTSIQKKVGVIDRKLNTLLTSLGLNPQKANLADACINQIAELYRAGKQDEAKQLAKEMLASPDEFKKAWQACKDETPIK